MDREEFTILAQEILGDRNDDKALEFAKACGEIFENDNGKAEIEALKKTHEEELEKIKADNDRLRNEYRDLIFRGKEATPDKIDTEPILTGAAQGTPDKPIPVIDLRGFDYRDGLTFDK